MAKIFVLDQQNKQVGSVDFVFSRGSTQSYIFVDIDVNYAATFHLRESTVLDVAGKAIASIVCGSNGKESGGAVVPVGRSFPNLGSILGSKAEGREANTWRVLGEVTHNNVRSEIKGIVGQLSIHWGSEDEAFYQQSMQDYADFTHMPIDRAQVVKERLRPVLYQNMMNLAGCAALIMKLFEQKKRG